MTYGSTSFDLTENQCGILLRNYVELDALESPVTSEDFVTHVLQIDRGNVFADFSKFTVFKMHLYMVKGLLKLGVKI